MVQVSLDFILIYSNLEKLSRAPLSFSPSPEQTTYFPSPDQLLETASHPWPSLHLLSVSQAHLTTEGLPWQLASHKDYSD